MSTLATIAFDIETTGFSTTDQLTVVGFDAEIGSRVFLNTDGSTCAPTIEQCVNERLTTPVTLSVHDDEGALLDAVKKFVDATIAQRDAKLVAYNGETWKGGFDLPFFRTRLSHHEREWPFAELPYIDVMEVFTSRFNTSENSLTGVYDELVASGHGTVDPFTDSSQAVDAWQTGDFEAVILHNVADIRRTRALMNVAERYCSKSDFSMKSLEPVSNGR
ncbi:ribonuclease H-like domain-containing protein [Halorubrum sp. DM2]|uniref:ribonuclease H-like domain-containing protein n=1 Tax=Halorubrum sp. DM2 TaxID=2527867 RepID=UPI0024B6D85C|nr:ribonuclease H-like domain-containing protein [Halorubrum sp. DM2]